MLAFKIELNLWMHLYDSPFLNNKEQGYLDGNHLT